MAAGPVLGWVEAGPLLLAAGLLAIHVSLFLGRHPAVAIGDPLLAQSERFEL